jgi:hypothetical protein
MNIGSMKKIFLILFAWVWCFIAVNQAWADGKSYSIRHVSLTDPEVAITKVTFGSDKTTLELELTCESACGVGIYPPGQEGAFFMTDAADENRYNLLGSEGVQIRPNEDHLSAGETIKFKLFFEKVPEGNFNLHEGGVSTGNELYWHFLDVKLTPPVN